MKDLLRHLWRRDRLMVRPRHKPTPTLLHRRIKDDCLDDDLHLALLPFLVLMGEAQPVGTLRRVDIGAVDADIGALLEAAQYEGLDGLARPEDVL